MSQYTYIEFTPQEMLLDKKHIAHPTGNFLVISVNFCAFLLKLNSKLYYMRKGTTLRVQPKPLSVTKRTTHEFDR